MIVTWSIYTLLVAAAVAAAARGLSGVLAALGVATRWVWMAAIAAVLALAVSAPYRGGAPEVRLRVTQVTERVAGGGAAASPLLDRLESALRAGVHEATAVPLRRLLEVVGPGAGAERPLLVAWGAMSALVLLAFAATALRHRAIRRRSPVTRLQGTEVRVAGDLGPVVTGVLRPEIVVPRWLLAAPAEEQSMVLAHEEEHRRAGDPLLLAGACVAIVLLPWNPAVWWMASRLRLATEMDCDARVLRRGARPLAYGSLLIDIAGRCSGLQPGVSAIAGSPSHLERRLRAMIPGSRRFGLLRGGALAALAVVATLAACEASMPTAADVASMDVGRAEAGAKRIALLPEDGSATTNYFIDGQPATADQAHALPSDRIVAMQVMKREVVKDPSQPGEHVNEVRILTKDASEEVRVAFRAAAEEDAAAGAKVQRDVMEVHGTGEDGQETHLRIRSDGGAQPVLIVDGVRTDPSELAKISPDRIAQVDVLKGEAATKLYGPEAAAGVIRITTKAKQ